MSEMVPVPSSLLYLMHVTFAFCSFCFVSVAGRKCFKCDGCLSASFLTKVVTCQKCVTYSVGATVNRDCYEAANMTQYTQVNCDQITSSVGVNQSCICDFPDLCNNVTIGGSSGPSSSSCAKCSMSSALGLLLVYFWVLSKFNAVIDLIPNSNPDPGNLNLFN